MPDVDLNALHRALYKLRQEAVTIPFEERKIASGPATEHECHDNCHRWVEENLGYKVVPGWLVFDYSEISQGLVPFCRFTAHSVIEGPDGTLVDITPSQASQRYPFLRHEGPAEEFEAIVQAGHIHIERAISVD
jgi:hypothetical protein